MPTFDPTQFKLRKAYNHDGTFFGLAANLDQQRLYAGSDDYGIHVYDLSDPDSKGAIARWAKHDNYVSAVAVVNGGGSTPVVVSGGLDRQLIWWNADTGEPLRTVEGHAGWVRDLVVFPDQKRLASAGDDMVVKIWEAASGRLLRVLEGHAPLTPQGHVTALYAVAVSPDGQHVAGGDRVGVVHVWEADTGKRVRTFEVPTLYTYDPRQRKRSIGGIRSLAFSPDGKLLAVGGIGQIGNVDGLGGPVHVELWDWNKPELRLVTGADGHKAFVHALIFHPAGDWLLGAGGGGDNAFLGFWKIDPLPAQPGDGKKDPVPVHRVKMDGHIHRLILDADKHALYAAGYRKLEIWGIDEVVIKP
ncbi:MAG: WD40 repeat domain-containing protein [Gemmataceae bacterium]